MGSLRLLLAAGAVAFLAWAVVRLARPAEVCRIEVRGRRAEMRGRLPGRARPEIVEFVESLDLPDGAVIVVRGAGSAQRIECNGAVPEAVRQRIRNFLMLRR
jgi:hypothetical protein